MEHRGYPGSCGTFGHDEGGLLHRCCSNRDTIRVLVHHVLKGGSVSEIPQDVHGFGGRVSGGMLGEGSPT